MWDNPRLLNSVAGILTGIALLLLAFAAGQLLLRSRLLPVHEITVRGELSHTTSVQIAQAVRAIWPQELPVFVRISATDWVEGGWDLPQSIQFARWLKEDGIDLIDCSSGGTVFKADIPMGPGYQTPFATAIRTEAGIPTGAVGFIIDPVQAEQIISTASVTVQRN